MNQNKKVKSMIVISMFTAVLVVLSYVSIPLPFSPVNLTGQTLGVMLIGCVLSPMEAFTALAVYLLLGAVGLPVFSGGHSGLGSLFGPTGGFLFGFWGSVVLISLFKGTGKNLFRLLVVNLVFGVLFVYLVGVPFLSFATHMPLSKAVLVGALPFIPGDLIKVFIASISAVALNKRLGIFQ